MSYRKGYYKKDGTYVQGHFVNKSVKRKKSKIGSKGGCLGFILLSITTVIISYTNDSNCASKNCSGFSTQVEAQSTFDSDRNCYLNFER